MTVVKIVSKVVSESSSRELRDGNVETDAGRDGRRAERREKKVVVCELDV